MFEAMFRGWLRGYEWALDKVLAHKFIVLSAHVRHPGGDVLALHDHSQGLLPDRGYRLHLRIDRRRVRHLVRRDGRAPATGRRDHPQGPGGGLRQFHRRRRVVRIRRPIPAACSSRSNPRKSAAKARLPSFSACGAPPTPSPAWRCISRTSRTSTSRAAFPRASISTRCNRAIPPLLYEVAPQMRDKIAKIEGLRDVTTDLYIKNPQMTIEVDREKAAVYGITVDQIRQELFNAFGAARLRPSTRRRTTIRSFSKACRSFRPIRRSCKRSSSRRTAPERERAAPHGPGPA